MLIYIDFQDDFNSEERRNYGIVGCCLFYRVSLVLGLGWIARKGSHVWFYCGKEIPNNQLINTKYLGFSHKTSSNEKIV